MLSLWHEKANKSAETRREEETIQGAQLAGVQPKSGRQGQHRFLDYRRSSAAVAGEKENRQTRQTATLQQPGH